MERLSGGLGGCLEGVEDCLDVVVRLSGGCGEASGECVEVV